MKIFCRRVFQEEETATRKDLQQNCAWHFPSRAVAKELKIRWVL